MTEIELEKIWHSVLTEIELQIPKASFATWLKSSRLIDKRDGTALISLPNNFTKTWVENKYNKMILGSIRLLDETTKNVRFIVQGADAPALKPPKEDSLAKIEFEKKQLAFPEESLPQKTCANEA
jgi:chromosomal replication initiator protein